MCSRRRGSPSRVPSVWTLIATFLLVVASYLKASVARGAQLTQPARGETRMATVPMVSEPWSATLSVPSAAPQKQVRFIGHFPGFHPAKQD